MSKSKYCYVLARKNNGDLLVEDGKLPFYWDRDIAKRRAKDFINCGAYKIPLAEIEKLVLKSTKC